MRIRPNSCDECKFLFEDISYLECENENIPGQLICKELDNPCMYKEYYHDCSTCKHFQKDGSVAFTIKHHNEDGTTDTEEIPGYSCLLGLAEKFNSRGSPETVCDSWEFKGYDEEVQIL